MRRLAIRLLPLLAATAALALAAGGCGSSTSATLDPVAQAAEATARVGGAHVSATGQVTVSGMSSPMTIGVEGYFNYQAREGALTMDMSGLPASTASAIPGGALHMQELIKSGSVYVASPLFAGRLPGGARWLRVDLQQAGQALGLDPQQMMGGQSNPAQTLEYLKASGGGVTVVGHDQVRGVQTTRYRGAIDLKKAGDVLPTGDRAKLRAALDALVAKSGIGSIPVEVWVDSHRLVRRMAMSISSSQMQMTMTIDLFGFGSTPVVNAPSASESFDATKTALGGLSSGG